MTEPVPHWLDAPGGVRLRIAEWAAGARGVVLLLNGRTEFIEKYAETVAALQARGFAVWSLDWRGQGASSRLHPDRVAHHVAAFEDYLADLDLVLDRLVLPGLGGRPLLMVAHSMGGHLGARMLARRPGVFERAVLLAPMIDFLRGRVPRWTARWMAWAACARPGGAARPGPGPPRLPDLARPFEDNPLTTCPERYAAWIALARELPEHVIGGVTWGWLRAATASIAVLDRAATVQRIGCPVLVAVAGVERFVDNRATRRFAARLRDAEIVEFPAARHELLRERDEHRLRLWDEIDRFFSGVGRAS